MNIKLKGWSKELPDWIIKAIQDGKITIHTAKDKKYGEYEYLKGEAYNGHMLVCFK